MICHKHNSCKSNGVGHYSRSGEHQVGMPKRGGTVTPLGFALLAVAMVAITGIGSLATSSCSQHVASSTAAPEPSPTSTSRKGVTMANYDKLQTGMTYTEVVEILGSAGKKLNADETAEPNTVTYMWGGDQVGNMRVRFRNDRLLEKSQYNLQ